MLKERSGKNIPSNKEAKAQKQESEGTFRDSKLTSSAGAKISLKNLRGKKARKVDSVST